MKNVISAIEHELKFMHDSDEGSKEYRKGYSHAFRVIAEFLRLLPCDLPPDGINCAAIERLLLSVSLERGNPLFRE